MSKSPSLALPNPKRWGLPLLIFAIALGLRLIGIGWGLPNEKHVQSYHPDEGYIWVRSQLIEPAKLNFTPHFYNYGTFYLTTLKLASDVVAGYAGGGVDPKNPDATWDYVRKCHLAGRIISALAGAGTALIVFLALRRFSNDFGAFFGGLAIAVAPVHVVHSQFQTVDVLATLLIALSSFYALRLIKIEGLVEKSSDVKLAVLSGLFCGLSAGTKYTGIFCLLTVFTIALATQKKAGIKLCLIALGVTTVSFLLVTPGAILESGLFIRDFTFEMKHTSEGHGLVFAGTSSGFIYHIANLFLGMGLILSILGLVGLTFGAYRKHLWAIGLLAFFLPYYILIGRAEVKFVRYTFPLYVGLGVGFGWMMGRAREKGGKWHGLVGLGMLGVGGFVGGGFQATARYLAWMAGPEPRDEAGTYLAGKDVSVGLVTDPWFYTPAFHPYLGQRYMLQEGIGLVGYSTYPKFDAAIAQFQSPRIIRFVPEEGGQRIVTLRSDWDERLIKEAGPDYIVYSSFETEGLDRIGKMEKPDLGMKAAADRARAFMDRLKQEYEFDRQLGPNQEFIHDLMYIQPTVWIWKRKAP
ncbi:MAG: glycosyltransferase family 39 protein [Chlorobia bacterium]|nr:glycosyltransferase family 39 protein [Fimbriimonadaceae bacterium]